MKSIIPQQLLDSMTKDFFGEPDKYINWPLIGQEPRSFEPRERPTTNIRVSKPDHNVPH